MYEHFAGRGLGPVRQSTSDQTATLKSSGMDMLRMHLRSAGFPEEEIENQARIVEYEGEIVSPLSEPFVPVGTSSGMRTQPTNSHVHFSLLPPTNDGVDSTSVGNFIRAVRATNLCGLTKQGEREPHNMREYRKIHKKNKRTFIRKTKVATQYACLNGKRIFHEASVYSDLIFDSQPGESEEALTAINQFVVVANKESDATDKLDPVRASLPIAFDWKDEDYDDI